MNSRIRTLVSVALAISLSAGLVQAQVQAPPTPVPEPSSTNFGVPDTQQLQAKLKDLQSKILVDLPRISSGSAAEVLVVPTAQMSVEDLSGVTEDMTVMRRILQTRLDATKPMSAVYGMYGNGALSRMFYGQAARVQQSVYLQGYGALFALEVDCPLAPGPEAPQEPDDAQTESNVDAVWQQTQMEVLNPGAAQSKEMPAEEGPKYSAEKVVSLKANTIEALKHASNIRALTDNDVVVVTITGTAPASNVSSVRDALGRPLVVVVTNGNRQVYENGLPKEIETAIAPTVLTIRAKVSDIKSYAAGNLNAEQFRDRVQILSHPQLGAGAARVIAPLFGG